jgi:hypothetical protein
VIDSDDIVAELFDDDVLLNRTVRNQAQSAEPTAAAQQVDGVKSVHNLLAVPCRQASSGRRRTRAAGGHTLAAPADVDVTARDGNVCLTARCAPVGRELLPKTAW